MMEDLNNKKISEVEKLDVIQTYFMEKSDTTYVESLPQDEEEGLNNHNNSITGNQKNENVTSNVTENLNVSLNNETTETTVGNETDNTTSTPKKSTITSILECSLSPIANDSTIWISSDEESTQNYDLPKKITTSHTLKRMSSNSDTRNIKRMRTRSPVPNYDFPKKTTPLHILSKDENDSEEESDDEISNELLAMKFPSNLWTFKNVQSTNLFELVASTSKDYKPPLVMGKSDMDRSEIVTRTQNFIASLNGQVIDVPESRQDTPESRQDTPELRQEEPMEVDEIDPLWFEELMEIEDNEMTVEQPERNMENADDEDILEFDLELKDERNFKNQVTEENYYLRLRTDNNDRLVDINRSLRKLFQNVVDRSTRSTKENDQIKVTLYHDDLANPITIPPIPVEEISPEHILDHLEKVLTSNQDLRLKDMETVVGIIRMPSGGHRQKTLRPQDFARKRSIVNIINHKDNLCAARAVAVGFANICQVSNEEFDSLPNDRPNVDKLFTHRKCSPNLYKYITKKDNVHKRMQYQKCAALNIVRLANLPRGRPVGLQDLDKIEKALDVNILVLNYQKKFLRAAKDKNRKNIFLFYDDNHYDCITSISGFFESPYFCNHCLKPYRCRDAHVCEEYCNTCLSYNCISKHEVLCDICNKICRSVECLARHKHAVFKDKNFCQSFFRCDTCYKVEPIERKQRHNCNQYFCKNCQQYVDYEHLCYLKSTEKTATQPNFVFYDFETTQETLIQCAQGYLPTNPNKCEKCINEEHLCSACFKCLNCHEATCGNYKHIPNLVVAHTICEHCEDSDLCTECGKRCVNCKSKACPNCPMTKEFIFDNSKDFFDWLITKQYAGFTCLAHNAKAFDSYFLLEYLTNLGLKPENIIFNGTKIMYLKIEKGLNIRFLDSMNFFHPMSLAKLPDAFGIKELKKGFFPHYFNTRENQNYVGVYPAPSFYGVDQMTEDKRDKFFKWYDTVKHQVFDFQKEFVDYCISDVQILKEACLKYRNLLLEISDIDPFSCMTAASVAMKIFRTNFVWERWEVTLKDGTKGVAIKKKDVWTLNGQEIDYNNIGEKVFIDSPLAQIPTLGYTNHVNFSKESIQWLEAVAYSDKIHIQHALNGRGEKKIYNYFVDGYCESTHTVYEYNSCWFHGCPTCHPTNRNKIVNKKTKQSLSELYALTLKKEKFLKEKGYKVVTKWSHEFQNDLKENPLLKEFVESLNLVDRLNPKDSFFGGRTNCIRLYAESNEDERIAYKDICSLYPFCLKYRPYPIKHAEIITSNFKNIEEYFGIAKIKILAVTNLYLPVLPVKINGKLMFPLCKTCAEIENQESCTNSDEERAFVGTWCTPEIVKAIQKGYEIINIYEVYHFPEKSDDLFKEYIDLFLKVKQESSDWPENCQYDTEGLDAKEVDRNRENYIKEYFEHEGILLDPGKICKNPGLRSVAKIDLNSLWGKFGQRLNFDQHCYFEGDELPKFYELLTDNSKTVKDFQIVNENLLLVKYLYKDFQLPEDKITNIFLATFTTCWARLKLYESMEKLGERVLYHDTDSIIYVEKPGEYNIPIGNFLGDYTDELKGDKITEFVSGGPKNYAYKTEKGNTCCKVRGFNLNFENSEKVNFEIIKDMVIRDMQRVVNTHYSKILRNQLTCTLYNQHQIKEYRIVYNKRVIDKNSWQTYPYGY